MSQMKAYGYLALIYDNESIINILYICLNFLKEENKQWIFF